MFKLLRNKIQALPETRQKILTILLILINVGIFIFCISLLIPLPKTEEKPTIRQEEEIPPEILQKYSAPSDIESEKIPEEILKKYSAPKK